MNENDAIKKYSLRELLERSNCFRVPLYQRSYAWGEQQIDQLLEDLYLAFKKNTDGTIKKEPHYYLGTLVVMQREDGVLEVVDGQQRLTTLTLLFRHLGLISQCNLRFENRQSATSFLQAFFGENRVCLPTPATMAAACQRFVNYTFEDSEQGTIKRPYAEALKEDDAFAKFLKEQVFLYQITLPGRSDVAKYFEVMNNRGVQLADVDVVKSRLMKYVKDQDNFRKRWNWCADFTRPRKLVEEEGQEKIPPEHSEARMDFPNFLLIALKLYENGNPSIALDERQLLNMFTLDRCGREEFAEKFLKYLEEVRDSFDDWFIRSDLNDQGNIRQWVIRPWEEEEKTADRKKLIALESMLEVTYTSRRYRKWVQSMLQCILTTEEVIDTKLIIRHLEGFVRKRLAEYKQEEDKKERDWLKRGTDTPHLVLNLLDYLFMEKENPNYLFRHRSSIEHFMPRDGSFSDKEEESEEKKKELEELKDSIGNLCLMSSSDNSALKNRSPREKVTWWDNKYKGSNLTPKQQKMYDLEKPNGWTKDVCAAHHRVCEEMLLKFLKNS